MRDLGYTAYRLNPFPAFALPLRPAENFVALRQPGQLGGETEHAPRLDGGLSPWWFATNANQPPLLESPDDRTPRLQLQLPAQAGARSRSGSILEPLEHPRLPLGKLVAPSVEGSSFDE